MPQVIIQPAAASNTHYADTIEKPVPLSSVRPYLSDGDYRSLIGLYDGGHVWVWGAKPSGRSRWARVQSGDIFLFYGNKRFTRSASVTMTCHNPNLAANLWGLDQDGETWENVFFLNNLRDVEIAVEDFNLLVGYEPNYFHPGFNILDQGKSDLALDAYELIGDDQRLQDFVDAIDAEPDNPRMGNVRGEQTELRRRLLRGRMEAPCSMRGDNLAEDLLVAAHIKKRSKCSREEKLDPQVVVLMCKLGCDALYEYGYLSVEHRMVTTRHVATDTPRITQLLGRLHGRDFPEWTDRRATYFDGHSANVPRSI